MESLLQWSLSNSTPNPNADTAPAPRQNLDPAIIDAILGKSDADLMKEDMNIIMDDSADEDDREGALDHFEMLVEQIDNANNMERLGLWTPLHSLLTNTKTPNAVILHTIWVIGTALQNNPEAQDSYMKLNPIPTLVSFLSPSSPSSKIRSKALYALSGLLKHNAPAVKALNEAEGWAVLKGALQDPDITVRRKAIFLLSTLLHPVQPAPPPAPLPSSQPTQPETIHANSHAANLRSPARVDTSPPTLAAAQKHGIVSSVVQGLVSPVPYGEDGDEVEGDVDYEEKCVEFLRTYLVDCKASLTDDEKASFKTWLQSQVADGGAEKVGLGVADLKELTETLG